MSNDKTFDEILAETKVKMEAEQQSTEEKAREEREENLRRAAATNYGALHQCFASADINSQEGTERVLNSIRTATAILMGEQSSSISTPALVTTSNIPFDWDSLNENQKNAMQLIADNDIVDKKYKVLETVITASNNRFFVRNSDSVVIDDAARAKKAAVAGQPTGNDDSSEASAPEPESTPAATPAVMPAKKTVAKKTAAVPAPAEEAEPTPASSSSDNQSKGWLDKAKNVGKQAWQNAKQ